MMEMPPDEELVREALEGHPKRNVVGHPGPRVPHGSQYYACEQPENPALYGVLFHTGCSKCVMLLSLAVGSGNGNILMFHGQSEGR